MSTHDKIRPQPGISDIELYVGGESKIVGSTKNQIIKLSSNENPYGASPKAIEAYRAAVGDIAIYPSSDHAELRAAIGDIHGVDPARVICGNGSGEIITIISQVYAGVGDEVMYTEHGFSMYPIYANAVGATPVVVKENNRVADVDAILAACTERTKIIFLANPNNPTGTMISDADVRRLAENIPAQAILVLDGAYAEFVDDEDFDAGLALVNERDNVVMTRTFSKIYGLSGIRAGWAYGPAHIIENLMRIRGPFNVTLGGQRAGLAALGDQDFVRSSREHNALERARFVAEIEALGNHGLRAVPSEANFVLVLFEGAISAEAALNAITDAGYAVRHLPGQGLPQALRITIGTAAQMEAIAACLRALAGEKA